MDIFKGPQHPLYDCAKRLYSATTKCHGFEAVIGYLYL